MDPIIMQKFQAIKKSKKSKKQQLVDKFFLYTVIAFTCSIFCSSPFWLPYLYSSVKGFFFISVRKTSSILYSPKLLFLVGNLIVVFLIGESKLFASGMSSLSRDTYYDEYVDRSRSLRNPSTLEPKKELKMMKASGDENLKWSCQVGAEVLSVTTRLVEEIIEVKKGKNDSGNEVLVLPTEELKKRADDFIARVNRQRRLEAGLLLN